MMDWFKSLDDREQKIVGLGAFIILLSFIYLLVWDPLSTGYQREKSLNKKNHELASWITQTSAEIRQLRTSTNANKRRIPAQSLLSTLDSSAKRAGLADGIRQMKPKGQNGVQVKLENVAFDQVIQWVHSLNSKHGIEATSVSTDVTANPGRVNARMTLEIPG